MEEKNGQFEYWVNITNARQSLDWHEDKNEKLAETTGKIAHPRRVLFGMDFRIVF